MRLFAALLLPLCVTPAAFADGDHTHRRAGHPEWQSPLARPSNTPRYGGYHVGGGGGVLKKDGRGPDEGTWGWDYHGGHWLRHRVALLWNHGRRAQGGTGAYKTDGPHVPDVIAGSISASHQLKKKVHGGAGKE